MRLYHTGNVQIPVPDLKRGRKNADFGQGFYMTPDREFTYRWAGRDAVINVYELDLTGLQVQEFQRSPEWFQYIFSNRRTKDDLQADVVMGPIANDTIYDTMGVISSGFLDPEVALQLLLIGPEYTQLVIKTQKALAQLRHIGTEQAPDHEKYAALLKQEQEDYQAAFAAAMEKYLGE